MDFYIIRDKNTKKFIPLITQRNKTSAKLTDKGVPRLFTTLRGASNALNWWLKGESFLKYYRNTYYEQGDRELEVIKQYDRDAVSMEIVKVRMVDSAST